jgi:hypothetical protein
MVRIYLDRRIRDHLSYQKSGPGRPDESIFGNMIARDGFGHLIILMRNPCLKIHNEEELTPFITSSSIVVIMPEKTSGKPGDYQYKSAICKLYLNQGQLWLEGSAKDFPDLRHLYQLIEAGTIESTRIKVNC